MRSSHKYFGAPAAGDGREIQNQGAVATCLPPPEGAEEGRQSCLCAQQQQIEKSGVSGAEQDAYSVDGRQNILVAVGDTLYAFKMY